MHFTVIYIVPSDTQGILLLALHSEMIPGRLNESYRMGDQTRMSNLQGKCGIYYAIALAPNDFILVL